MGKLNKIWKSIREYRTDSIYFNGLIKIILPVMLLIIAFTVIVFALLKNSMKKETEYNLEKFNQVYVDMADTIFKESEKIVKNIAMEDDVRNYIVFGSNNLLNEENYQRLKTIISAYKIVNEYIDSIYIYTEKNNQIFVDSQNILVERCSDMGWLESVNSDKTDEIQFISRLKDNLYPQLISVADTVNVSGYKGVIVLNINAEKIDELTGIHGEAEKYIIKNGEVLYQNDFSKSKKYTSSEKNAKRMLGMEQGSYTDRNYFLMKTDSGMFNWSYVYIENLSQYGRSSAAMMIVIILMIFIIFTVIFFVVNTVMNELYGHMNVLDSILKGNVDPKTVDNSSWELKNISKKILRIIDSNENIKKELGKSVKMLNETKIKTLQMQINPHFLYNSLNAVYMQTVDDFSVTHKSSTMVLRLSELLSGYLDIDRDIVTVKEEIKYSKIYVDFMNERRYDNICKMIWDIDESIYCYMIPKFTLQPIIENAFYHGVVCSGDSVDGIITIRAGISEDKLYFEVVDNGVGMSESRVKEINEDLESDENSYDRRHIGLKNVNTRLKILFGNDCGVHVESEEGKYSKITIRLGACSDIPKESNDISEENAKRGEMID